MFHVFAAYVLYIFNNFYFCHDFRGSIQGSGVVFTPKNERIVRYWKETDKPVLLPDAVRAVIQDDEVTRKRVQIEDNKINGARRAAALRDYISSGSIYYNIIIYLYSYTYALI